MKWVAVPFDHDGLVAPFTGAWIEMSLTPWRYSRTAVAPFTGAWIEICADIGQPSLRASRTLHGCVD